MADDILMRVDELKPGMALDLEGDRFADPKSENTLLAYEYAPIEHIHPETPECIVIYGDANNCAFPPDHQVKVRVNDDGTVYIADDVDEWAQQPAGPEGPACCMSWYLVNKER